MCIKKKETLIKSTMDFEETLRWAKSREQKNKIDFYIDRYLIPIVSILIVVVLYVSVYYFVEDEEKKPTKKVKVMRIPRALPQTIKENPLNRSEENQKKIRVVRENRNNHPDSISPVTATEDVEKDLGETHKSQGTETRINPRTAEKDRRNPQTTTRKSPATKKPFIEEISEQDSPITEQNQENQGTAEKDRRNPQIAERDGAEKTLKISETIPHEDSKSPVTATEDAEKDPGETRKSQGIAETETRTNQRTAEKDRRNPQTITRKSPATKKPFIEEISEQDSPKTEQNQETEDSSSPVTATEDVEKDLGETRKSQGITETETHKSQGTETRNTPKNPLTHPEPEEEIVYIDDETGNPVNLEEIEDYEVVDS